MWRTFTCVCCRCNVPANPRSKGQQYCGKDGCQRARKRAWQRAKMATDPDYRANQRDAQKQWRESNPGYWRNYRRCRSPTSRPSRPAATPDDLSAKMDALAPCFIVNPGRYLLVPIVANGAKMDALEVKITPITTSCPTAKKDSIGFSVPLAYDAAGGDRNDLQKTAYRPSNQKAPG